MKVLFAVSNEEISEAIVKKYQKEYKQIISYKNVYYFNAILKELQKDKSYDRVVISEDLEAFTHTQYEQIDKFIFEKLDSISDEAANLRGNDIPIILICSDRRNKSEEMLVKLFGIGIYDAIIGTDRSVDEVCALINRPRSKKDAKSYYKIESDDVNYQSENENDVSEVEIQNILAHYKRLGKNEDRYLESFDNIAAQYNDTQLRIISKFLPLNVRAVLEERSTKYQQIMSFNNKVSDELRKPKKEEPGTSEKLLTPKNRQQIAGKQVVIPSSVNMNSNKKLAKTKRPVQQEVQEPEFEEVEFEQPIIQQPVIQQPVVEQSVIEEPVDQQPIIEDIDDEIDVNIEETPKRRRGRPRKNPIQEKPVNQVKRGRGRPRKNPVVEETNQDEEEILLPGLNEIPEDKENDEDILLPGLNMVDNSDIENTDEDNEEFLPGLSGNTNNNVNEIEDDEEDILPGLSENDFNQTNQTSINNSNYQQQSNYSNVAPQERNSYENIQTSSNVAPTSTHNNYTSLEFQQKSNNSNSYKKDNVSAFFGEQQRVEKPNVSYDEYDEKIETIDLSYLLKGDKKIVTFVGTSKNGTSFIVNNLAELISSYGVNTAILDTTANKNSYYIYTKNEENLRVIASNSIEGLANGVANGVQVNKNLTVYTSVPNEGEGIRNVDKVLETLLKQHTVILIDTDFETPNGYFKQSQETYLVQSLDILTIQPLTAFLRELKAKNILDENKLRIILNKAVKIRGVSEKTIIGGMAYYNDPAMSFMTELFDRNTIRYFVVPFEQDTYVKYLESIIECNISLKGYSKAFMQSLKELSNMVYNISNTYMPPSARGGNPNTFSPNINNTLNQMKNNY